MYKLSNEEMMKFVDKHFPIWKKDIFSVYCKKRHNKRVYLINNHYIYVI